MIFHGVFCLSRIIKAMNPKNMSDDDTNLALLKNDIQIKNDNRKKRKRIITIVFVLLISIVAIYAFYILKIVSSASSRPFSLNSLETDVSGRTNVLVLGIGDPGHSGEKLSDTMLVMSINTSTHRATYISVPRDLRVRLNGYGAVKINQANALGGSQLARTAVGDVLGIRIQYSVSTDFNGLKELVNAIGGVDVNVADSLSDPEYPCSEDENRSCGLSIAAGPQHMNGMTALQYVRCRKGNCGNDFGRAARQQEIFDLIRAKIVRGTILLHPLELASVASAVKNNMNTDMSGLNLVEFVQGLSQAKADTQHFVLSTDTGGLLVGAYGSSDLLPIGGDFSRIHDKISSLIKN